MTDALVLLVLVWAALLVPSALRSRKASPHVTVGGFERAMNVLRSDEHHGGRQLLVPSDAGRIVDQQPSVDPDDHGSGSMSNPQDPMMAQRRSRFLRALVGTAAALALAVAFGGWLWPVFVVVAGGTGGYVVILRHLKLQRDEARRVVRELDLLSDDVAHTPPVAVAGGVGGGLSDGVASSARGDDVGGSVRLRRWED